MFHKRKKKQIFPERKKLPKCSFSTNYSSWQLSDLYHLKLSTLLGHQRGSFSSERWVSLSNRVLQHWPQSLKQSPSLTICIITTVFHWKYRGLSLKKITVHSPSHWLLSLNKPNLKVSFTTGDLTRDCGLYPKHNLNLRIKTESVTVGADATEYIWFLGQID